ncbi:MAG TPA: phosphatidate cytidylyltransferase [Burkholderiales bacterium]|nr:phosphatidate cytidylyltransferase [Burkholderiales bacterium]
MLTATVLIVLLLAGLFFLPRTGVALLMALIVAIGGFEWARLCGLGVMESRIYAAAIVIGLLALVSVELWRPAFVAGSAFWILAVPAWLWFGLGARQRSGLIPLGFLVLVPPALAMVALEPLDALLALAVAWIADTAAYFAGRRWGRRKLAPSISPGKTWEGAAGGLIGAAAYAMILSILFAGMQGTRMAAFLGAAALLVAVSIVGDLFESAVKRQAGVKDSGSILPGHGGMLDRIDSATAVLPVAALLVPWLKGAA